jgi:hypothetical protein
MPEGTNHSSTRRKVRRAKRRRRNRKLEKMVYDLSWLLGGLAIGLPLLGIVLYLLSR